MSELRNSSIPSGIAPLLLPSGCCVIDQCLFIFIEFINYYIEVRNFYLDICYNI